MKDYKKFMRGIGKDSDFEVVKTTKSKPTIKLKYLKTGEIYSIHPGNNAVRPLKRWIRMIKMNINEK